MDFIKKRGELTVDFIHEKNRIFAVNEEGRLIAEVTFPNIGDYVVNINHTFVDASLRGQGVASQLLEEAYEEIKKQGKTAVMTCSYAKKWFAHNPLAQDIMAR